METLILVSLYFGIAYLLTKIIRFKHTSSFVAFVVGLSFFSTETRILLFCFLVVISCQIAKNYKTYKVKYAKSI